ncbi:SDR family oxidoreductase [Spirillospora sp. NPDC047279]|uniref:SDR family oxidoreductase n=1 Tax=Spirillospora sp. NPDC047279 TaxID=3155478 RepID=UPI0033D3DF10
MRTATPRLTILLVGASGVVGQALIPKLAPHRVIGLTHRQVNLTGCETLPGDLTRPWLGLAGEDHRRLAADVDVVIHSGALTEWGLKYERYQSVNVDGARHVLELAEQARAPVHFMSTCFVHALAPAAPVTMSESNVVLPYITSKLQAERLLRESGHPVTIYRPTNLVGDSRTGASSEPQIVQAVSDWICHGRAPYFPAHPGNLIDVAPQDMLADAVRCAVEAGDVGADYWITYGDAAMAVEETLEICLEHAHRRGRPVPAPPIVDPSRPLPIPLDDVDPWSRSFVSVLLDVSETVAACGGVLPSSLADLRAAHGLEPPCDRESYRRSLRYWAEAA